jgi:Ca-activated chloride channel homolog
MLEIIAQRFGFLIGFLAAIVVGLSVGKARGEGVPEKTLSPYFFVEKGDTSPQSFPLKSTNVDAKVNGVIADVYVTQTYVNDGKEPIHAKYVFPASTRASVHGMKVKVGDIQVTAKIKEREKAKQEFDQAKKEGKSASLLEQQRPNVFSMNVANILPKDVVEVELHYTELLVPTDGVYQFVYPTVVGPRYSSMPESKATDTEQWVKSPYLKEGKVPPTRFDVQTKLSTSIPLQEVSSPSHKVNVSWKKDSVAVVSLADTGEFTGNRDYILNYRLSGQEIQSGLLLSQGTPENFFLLMVQPPRQVSVAQIPPREYIFVLDVSGSMVGFPLDTAKTIMRNLIEHLRPTDLFNVILFSGASRTMSPFSVPATTENVEEAIYLIEHQMGGGGTELSQALQRALSIPRQENISRTVAIVTDGYIQAEKEAFELIEKNLNRTNFFSFGIGSSVNRYLIEGIARMGLGEPFVVTKPEESNAVGEKFRNYIQSPVLTNIQVKYEGFSTYDVEPPSIPDLFAERPIVLFGKWRGKPEGEIVVSGMGGAGKYVRSFRVSETKPSKDHDALKYLWARTKISRLSDFASVGLEQENQPLITSLGLQYSLLTRYTSFIAVVEKIRNKGGKGDDVDQPLPLPQGVSNLAVGYGMGAEPELWILILAAGLIPLGFMIRKRGVV